MARPAERGPREKAIQDASSDLCGTPPSRGAIRVWVTGGRWRINRLLDPGGDSLER